MAEKPYYPIIFLIIASENDPLYNEMKNISMQYYSRYLLVHNKVRFFYLYCKPESETKGYDLCFPGYDESLYPGIFYKTAKAMQYVEKTYDYELIVRTNLSTFWNIDVLFTYMEELLEKCLEFKYVSGPQRCFYIKNDFIDGDFTFIDGYAIIFSKDVVQDIFINNDPLKNNYFNKANDDLCISKLLQDKGYKFTDLGDYSIKQLTNEVYDESLIDKMSSDEFNKTIAYRIKNTTDRNIDIQYMRKLFGKIYI
jgi:hypothetical protein